MKKRIAPIYDMKNALLYEHRMNEHIDRWCEKIAKMESTDITPWCHYVALDVISDIFYGKSMGFVENGGDLDNHMESMKEMWYTFVGMVSVPWLTKLRKKLFKPDFNAKSGIPKLWAFTVELVNDRVTKGNVNGKPHLAEYIASQIGRGECPMSQDVAVGEIFVSIMAGSDSVANALVPIIYLLTKDRRVYSKIKEEIADAGEKGKLTSSVVTYNETLALPYVTAAIREAMRLNPSFPSAWPRSVPKEGSEILPGVYVPGGTAVGVNSFITNRDKAVFGDDANEFLPERWLTPDLEKKYLMDKFESTFSYKYSI